MGEPNRVEIYDTTLRDGTQCVGVSFTCADKLRIAERLDDFGVAFIEGGYPASNPKDAEFFARAQQRVWKHAQLTAFGSTRRAKHTVESDPGLTALLESRAPVCTLFGKSSPIQVTEVLRVGLEDNLRMIEESVAYLVRQDRRVVYDAEHFFDAYAADSAYALETLLAAERGGASVLVLCDTNGGTLPWQIEARIAEVRSAVKTRLGIHAHNDGGCAVANTLAAVQAGVRHVQGTINGYGERCGNTNLCTTIADLELKMGYTAVRPGALRGLSDLSNWVAEVANLAPDDHAPYTGTSAFAHKGGAHVAALRRHSSAYNHIDPELVGNRSHVVLSELAGRANVQHMAEESSIDLDGEGEVEVLQQIKAAEAKGAAFDAAEASVELMMRRQAANYRPLFRLLDFMVMVGNRAGTGEFSEATIKIAIGDEIVHTADEGNGPVSALHAALRKALLPTFPQIANIHLVDYKVRILDSKDGPGAITRVLIDSRAGSKQWSTVGASTNIIEASWQALCDSVEYGLTLGNEET